MLSITSPRLPLVLMFWGHVLSLSNSSLSAYTRSTYPDIFAPLLKYLGKIAHRARHSLHHGCQGKSSDANGESEYLVTCYSLIHGISAKGWTLFEHILQLFCSQKPMYTTLKGSQAAFSLPVRTCLKF